MDISIRKHILSNLDDSNFDQVKEVISESIRDGEELTLPGLGVLFEILWNHSNDDEKARIVTIISDAIGHNE